MKIITHKNWLMLILLIFIGQTIALPFVDFNDCETNHSTSIILNKAMPHHEMSSMPEHDMLQMGMNSQMGLGITMDCCADDCQCSDGLSVSTVYLSSNENNVPIFIQNKVIFQESQFSNNQRSSSIYRPPILS